MAPRTLTADQRRVSLYAFRLGDHRFELSRLMLLTRGRQVARYQYRLSGVCLPRSRWFGELSAVGRAVASR